MSNQVNINIENSDEENVEYKIYDNIDEKEKFYEGYYLKQYLGNNRQECSICIDNDAFTYKSWVKLGCSHYFHEHCINMWTVERPTCPICRDDIYQSYRRYIIGKSKNKMDIILCYFLSILIFILVIFIDRK